MPRVSNRRERSEPREAGLLLTPAEIAKVQSEWERRKILLDTRLIALAERKGKRAVRTNPSGDPTPRKRRGRGVSSVTPAGGPGDVLQQDENQAENATISATKRRRAGIKRGRGTSSGASTQDPLAQAREAARRLKPGITDEELRSLGLLA